MGFSRANSFSPGSAMSTLSQPVGGRGQNPARPSVLRDLLIVVAVTVAVFILSSVLELTETAVAITRPLEAYQVDELPTTFMAMILALAWFSWRRSRQAIDEVNLRLAAQHALAEALAENRLLSQRYVQLQEEERRQLARELHDELGQSLNAIKLDAVAIRDQAQAPAEVRKSAQEIVEVSSQVYDTVRSLMRQLRPVALDELGLAPAIQFSIDQWQRRHPEVRTRFSTEGELDGLDEKVNMTVYRLVQECLTNVTKHAQASEVKIHIARLPSPPSLHIDISDNGRGFDLSLPRNGLGLVGLRERVEALDGRFSLESEPGRGLRVEAAMPWGEPR